MSLDHLHKMLSTMRAEPRQDLGSATEPGAPTPLLRNDYPTGAVNEAIDALELAYSYLRETPVVGAQLSESLRLLYRARELSEGIPAPQPPLARDPEWPLVEEC